MDGCLLYPKRTIVKLHVNWGHASAQQLSRVLAGSDEDNMHLATETHEVVAQCEVRRAHDEAPHVPFAGTPTVPMFNGKL